MSTITNEMTMTDGELVVRRSDKARDELARRVEDRRRIGMPIGGLLRPGAMQAAPEPTLAMLADLGVSVAKAEVERRRLSGERNGG